MAIRVKKVADFPCLIVELGEFVGTDSCRITYEKLSAYDAGHSATRIFYDLSRVRQIDLTFQDLQGQVGLRRAFYDACEKTTIAVFATSDLAFGMGRMYAMLLDQFRTVHAEAFRELDLAAAFLGLPKLAVLPEGDPAR